MKNLALLFAVAFSIMSGASWAQSSASNSSEESHRTMVSAAVARLQDVSQSVRDEAAIFIRDILKRDPGAADIHGEAHWRGKLAQVKPDMKMSEIKKILGLGEHGRGLNFDEISICGGGSCSEIGRLDDYWIVHLVSHHGWGSLNERDTSSSVKSLLPKVRAYWVEPPQDFSGRWITYHANGQPAKYSDYVNGHASRIQYISDTGELLGIWPPPSLH